MTKPIVLALIPARLGSKGVKSKNVKPLAGGPSCVERAIACAKASGVCDRILVSTDDPEAERQALAAGVEVHQRSAWAATDEASINDVIEDVLDGGVGAGVEVLVLLQPSSPLRQPFVIQQALVLLQRPLASGVVSVQPLRGEETMPCRMLMCTARGNHLFPVGGEWNVRRQNALRGWYRDGQIYAFWLETWHLYENIYGDHVWPLSCPAEDALSIDTEADWQEAERRIREQGKA